MLLLSSHRASTCGRMVILPLTEKYQYCRLAGLFPRIVALTECLNEGLRWMLPIVRKVGLEMFSTGSMLLC